MIDAAALPATPGCYLFKDRDDVIIYVGKAKNIRKRVESYVSRDATDLKTAALRARIHSVDFVATDTETEALLLENTLIKKHQPKYNVRLKDAKNYAFIRLTEEPFPRLVIARRRDRPGRYFGPFVSADERDYVLRYLQKTFALRTCRRLPRRPCLRYHIGICSAPCAGLVREDEYGERVVRAVQILSGKTDEVIRQMEHSMKEHADARRFERALVLRNQVSAIRRLGERQNMRRQRTYNEDVIGYRADDDRVYLLVFNIYRGTLAEKHAFVFDRTVDFFEDFVVQFYADHPVPRGLIVPEPLGEDIATYLSHFRGGAVKVTVPRRGAKRDLLALAEKNIDTTFFADSIKVRALQERLHLRKPPVVVECFDISHLSGTATVGSMVRFVNGRPDKSGYRRFKIRTVAGIDDCAAIAEVVKRRYRRLRDEQRPLPDLVIVDGGRGQLNAALASLARIDVGVPVAAVAKQHEDLFLPGRARPLRLKRDDVALHYIQEMRDEAHRFALAYNRLLRKKEAVA
jgi:excinuclease ABC subunit C